MRTRLLVYGLCVLVSALAWWGALAAVVTVVGCAIKAPPRPPPVLTPAAPLLAVPGVARWTGWLPGAVRRAIDLEPADPAALEAKRREGEELGRREEARAMWRRHARHMGVLGGACLALGLFTAAASFFVPLIPRKAAWVCFALCGLLWVGQYAVTVYGVVAAELLVWGSVAFAAVAAWPWAMAVVRWSHARAGAALAADPAHVREGVALQAAAKGWSKERRKAELAKANERLQNLAVRWTITDRFSAGMRRIQSALAWVRGSRP